MSPKVALAVAGCIEHFELCMVRVSIVVVG